MPGPEEKIRDRIATALGAALAGAMAAGELPPLSPEQRPPIIIETPKDKSHGDLATNLAMVLARPARMNPRQVAETLVKRFDCNGTYVDRIDIAGPGFINFALDPAWLRPVLADIDSLGADYGRSNVGGGKRVQIEYVSANPTGPLLVVNCRAAALGDALASVMQAAGYVVEREYYYDNMGVQVATLGRSMDIRVRELNGETVEFPEDCYPGQYVVELAKQALHDPALQARLAAAAGDPAARQKALADFAVEKLFAEQQVDLERFGTRHDTYFNQASLVTDGETDRTLAFLTERGHVYEADGAKWLRTTDFGDDKDRVLVKSDGEPTYFLLDIAYHWNKHNRGFTQAIDIWGQDHHGHVRRMQAAMAALGLDRDWLQVLLTQMVRIFKGGELVKLSKRAGNLFTMAELLDEVSVDAARFFFLMRAPDTHMDFDMDLAKLEASDNPVFYVQYAHARLSGILRQATELGAPAPQAARARLELLAHPSEISLMKKLAAFPGEVAAAAEAREPHRLTVYLRELATAFHAFYDNCRVLGEDDAVRDARLVLCNATRIVFRNGLGLLGVTAPERM
ncbi:MAG: arginine--tRNA ligase [Chloroflexota bacterium]